MAIKLTVSNRNDALCLAFLGACLSKKYHEVELTALCPREDVIFFSEAKLDMVNII